VRLSAIQELNWVREVKPFFYQRRRQELSSLAKETRLGELYTLIFLFKHELHDNYVIIVHKPISILSNFEFLKIPRNRLAGYAILA